MKPTLPVIQKIIKIYRILCKVAFVFSLIGIVTFVLGLLFHACGVGELFKIGGVTIYGILLDEAGISSADLYAGMIDGLLYSISWAVLAFFNEKYAKHELEAGTPFTEAGAAEMLRLGVLNCLVPIGAAIISGICSAIVGSTLTSDAGRDGSVVVGILFLFLALVFRHGAELASSQKPQSME